MTTTNTLLRIAALASVAIGLAGTINPVVDAYALKAVPIDITIPVGSCCMPSGNNVTYTEQGGVCWANFSNPPGSLPEKDPNGGNLNATACALQAQHTCLPGIWIAAPGSC